MDMLTSDDIKEIRKAMGLTPTEFAARFGVSASTVCLWEQGKTHPRWKKMLKLNAMREKLNGQVAR
jgi:DNA-binding transcriptional regulator YiaG